MLILRRRPGQRITITHSSGDVIELYIRSSNYSMHSLEIGLKDDARNFVIERPERKESPTAIMAG